MRASPIASILLVAAAHAQVVGFEIAERGPVAQGRAFGATGAYERIEGRVALALDPADPRNARIVDLALAPRDDQGRVEAVADVVVLQPVDPEARGVGLVEVCNRGGRASLRYFNGGRTNDLASDGAVGDGLLMRLGLTVVWIGWQWDVPHFGERLRLRVPIAKSPDGTAIRGPVRADWVVDEAASWLALGHREHDPYRPVEPDSSAHRMTRRRGREAEREPVPRAAWAFRDDGRAIVARGEDFEAGWIYELVYLAEDPRVVGIGLAAVRDVASFMKHDDACPFRVDRAIAIGISQTGRFLRHFVWQGFNTDTEGRLCYEGVLALTAGAGRGSFNHRFAQPSRDAHRYSAFFFPTDLFPFTSATQVDPITGRDDGLFAHQHDDSHLPRVFWINTGYEYWGRAAALIHTTVDGEHDVEPTEHERIYHLAGAQHYPGRFDRGNPTDILATYRALLVAMIEWVRDGREPPASRYPRLGDGTLVRLGAFAPPVLDGVDWPRAAHVAYRADYGARFWTEGVVTREPPRLGAAFPALVPAVDENGNERAGVRGVELRAPVATYLPHALRADGELDDFVGRFVPRPDLLERWRDRDEYLAAVARAVGELVDERFLLPEDSARATQRAARAWEVVSRKER